MTDSVTSRATFRALTADGDRQRHGSVRVRSLPVDHPAMQPNSTLAIAFAFNRRFGSAVERNRAKRRLRAALVDADVERCRGAVLMSGSRDVLDRPYRRLVDDVRRCVAHLRVDDGSGPSRNRPDLDNVREAR